MISILQLAGLDDANELLLATTDESGQRRFLEFDWLSPLLEPLDPKRFRHRILLYGGLKNPISLNITPDLVYNSVSNPDRCSQALKQAQHAAKNNPYPFINHPAIVSNTRADNLFRIAASINDMIVPKCIRITPNSLSNLRSTLNVGALSAPLLFEEAGTSSNSKNSFLLEKMEDVHRLECFAFD